MNNSAKYALKSNRVSLSAPNYYKALLAVLCLQAHLLEFNELEALPPKVLQQKIRDLLKQNPDLAEAVRKMYCRICVSKLLFIPLFYA